MGTARCAAAGAMGPDRGATPCAHCAAAHARAGLGERPLLLPRGGAHRRFEPQVRMVPITAIPRLFEIPCRCAITVPCRADHNGSLSALIPTQRTPLHAGAGPAPARPHAQAGDSHGYLSTWRVLGSTHWAGPLALQPEGRARPHARDSDRAAARGERRAPVRARCAAAAAAAHRR